MTLHVICTVFKRAIQLRRFIDCFILQTNPNWRLYVIHDGEPTKEIIAVMSLYDDSRISFTNTEQVNGFWGHPNRKLMLQKLSGGKDDFVLISNDDNIYVPTFVEYFMAQCHSSVGMVYCNTIHSYMQYNILLTKIKENHIDMGSFIIRLNVAKTVGFNHTHLSADGRYAVECFHLCQKHRLTPVYINKALFIHC